MSKYKSLLLTPGEKQQAAFRGLLNMGQALSAAGGYSTMPQSTVQALGQGLGAFMPGYDKYAGDVRQRRSDDLAFQQQQMQIEQQKMALEAAKRNQLQKKRYQNWQDMGGTDMAGNAVPMPMTDQMSQYMFEQQNKAFRPTKPTAPKTTRTAQGVFTLNPDGTLGERLGDLPPTASTNINLKEGSTTDQRLIKLLDTNDEIGQRIQRLRTMEELAARTPTGLGAEWKGWATQFADAIGFDVNMDKVNSLAEFRVQQMNFVMDRISGTKGSISEKEMDAFAAAGPNIFNTPKANIIISKVMRAQEEREFMLNEIEADALARTGSITKARAERLEARKKLKLEPVLPDEDINYILSLGDAPSENIPDDSPLTPEERAELESLEKELNPNLRQLTPRMR